MTISSYCYQIENDTFVPTPVADLVYENGEIMTKKEWGWRSDWLNWSDSSTGSESSEDEFDNDAVDKRRDEPYESRKLREQRMQYLDIADHIGVRFRINAKLEFTPTELGKIIVCNNNFWGGDCYKDTYNLITGTADCSQCGTTFCRGCCLRRCPMCSARRFEALNLTEVDTLFMVEMRDGISHSVIFCGELSRMHSRRPQTSKTLLSIERSMKN